MNAVAGSSWRALAESPLAFVRESALQESFGRPVSAEQLAVLRQAPRFAPRLERRLIEHYRLRPLNQVPEPDEADFGVLSLPDEQFARLAILCGAVWHAATLSREIRGEVVSQYREMLGAQAMQLALRLRHLAGAADLLRTPAALLEAIERDGAACLRAWLATQPEPLRDWLELRLHFPSAPATVDGRRAEVVRSVAAGLASAHDNEAQNHD